MDLMKSNRRKGDTSFGVDHRGNPRGVIPTKPGMVNPNDRTAEHMGNTLDNAGNIARQGGKPKVHAPTPEHGGMHHVTADGTLATGISRTASFRAPDGSNPNPADPSSAPVKKQEPVALTRGMRSRTTPDLDTDMHKNLGALILAEAKRN